MEGCCCCSTFTTSEQGRAHAIVALSANEMTGGDKRQRIELSRTFVLTFKSERYCRSNANRVAIACVIAGVGGEFLHSLHCYFLCAFTTKRTCRKAVVTMLPDSSSTNAMHASIEWLHSSEKRPFTVPFVLCDAPSSWSSIVTCEVSATTPKGAANRCHAPSDMSSTSTKVISSPQLLACASWHN